MSSSDSDNSVTVTDDTSKPVPKGSKTKKKRKLSKPSFDVLTIINIVDKSKLIKNDICSKLSKKPADFSNITSKHIADCSSLKKTNLAEHLMSLVAVCDTLACSSLELPSPNDANIGNNIDSSSIETTINNHMNELNKSNNFAFESIQEQVKRLEQLMSDTIDHKHSSHLSRSPLSPDADIHPPSPTSKLEVDSQIELIPDFVSDPHTLSALTEHLAAQSDHFNTEGERSVIYFGDHDYSYSGKVHKAAKPPEIIGDIISTINQRYPDKRVNSCLVTRYVDGNEHCPPHHDNEDDIAPDSNIYTLSLGAERHMMFQKPADPDYSETKLLLPHGSLLVFSRLSQCVYKHSIPCEPDLSTLLFRYSLTFRNIAPGNRNSTVILGDSNTQSLKFGETRDSFGKWMPGKVMRCMKVDQIPPPAEIGPYKNIVIHTGVNDVKFANRSLHATLRLLEQKCTAITDVFPSSNVYICPLLPTKDHQKNINIYAMNNGIYNLSRKHQRILLMSNYYDMFADQAELLKPTLGRFQRGRPSTDDIHLGQQGIRLLAMCIKHCVLKRRGPIDQYVDYNNIDSINQGGQSSRVSRSPYSGNYAGVVNHDLRHD